MARSDLLSITVEDLVTFTNRGTVNRAQREVNDASIQCEFLEDADGTVKAKWSDSVECSLPGGKTAREGRCTCPSLGMCRHLVRTILKYKQARAPAQDAAAPTPWCPGDIPDELLTQHIPKPLLEKARQQFKQGILADVVRAVKPSAFLHGMSVNVRFLVPGDPRYTHADCGPQLSPLATALAVWAFRALPKEKSAGLISTASERFTAPAAVLDQIETCVNALLEHGFSAAPEHFGSTLTRAESACMAEGLIWPADVLAALAEQFQRYANHDALFQPDTATELVGELLARSDAIRENTPAVPQPFIRGTRDDRPVDLSNSRYIGLGCGVISLRKSSAIHAYMQDQDSGMVIAICREFANGDSKEPPADFAKLALTPVVQRSSLFALGQGTLLLSGGKRSPSRRLSTARARSTVNPQSFQWETLREPVRVEMFAELRERLAELPPTVLRPRRVVDNFHVLKVSSVADACFVPLDQTVRATLRDEAGQEVQLSHAYSDRARGGVDALLQTLTKKPESVRFVAGAVKLSSRGLQIHPTAVVYEENGSRKVIQPWVDVWRGPGGVTAGLDKQSGSEGPNAAMLLEICGALSELLVLGLRRSDSVMTSRVKQLSSLADGSGFRRLADRLSRLATVLDQKQHSMRWDAAPAIELTKELLVIVRLGFELV